MRVVLLTNGQPNQKALAHRISEVAELAGVVVSANVPKKKPSLGKSLRLKVNAIAGRTVGRPLVDAWKEMLEQYRVEFPDFPAKMTDVRNVNDDSTIAAIETEKPDLVVVSGTNLVGKRVIEVSNRHGGIVNLHTGISPYVRGGPNCTNWCLAKGWFDRIGNTVMWLGLGIDTGNIIATERTELDGTESLTQIHRKVMDHGHTLYAKVLSSIARGKAVPSVRQREIAEGSHFNSVDWSMFAMRRAVSNYRRGYKKFFDDHAGRPPLGDELKLFPIADV